MKRFKAVYLLPFFCLVLYSGFLFTGKVRTAPNKFNYYKEMAISLMSGRLDITCPPGTGCHDLLNVRGKYYFYYGPAPTLVFLSLVPFWGRGTPDSMIAAVTGALNIFLFIGVFFQIRKKSAPPEKNRSALRAELRSRAAREDWYYAILWGLGSVHFYMSMHGDIWYLSQVMAQTFLLGSAWLILTDTPYRWIASGFFFALACYTRYNLLFVIPFFLAVIHVSSFSFRIFTVRSLLFGSSFIVFSGFMLVYNYLRFGDALELGLNHMQLEQVSGFAQRAAEVGIFSIQNFIANFYHEVLQPPPFQRSFPFIILDSHGFGILWATPVYLLVLPVVVKLYRQYQASVRMDANTILAAGCLISACAVATFTFMLSGHGFMQFAARYTLDFQLFVILFLALQPGLASPLIMWVFLTISVYMNSVGAYLFSDFFRKGIS